MPKGEWNKIDWTPEMEGFLRDNYNEMENCLLAFGIGRPIQTVRDKLYTMGLYRMRMEYWTDEQIKFLKDNYKHIGDIELAKIFNEKFPKEKGWTHKHVEKKRKYLKLKRTERQKWNIRLRNIDQGYMDKMHWRNLIRRKVRIGTCIVRIFNGYKIKFVRVKGGFRKLAHLNYEKAYGPIPKGMMMIMKDKNPMNCDPENLRLISRAEYADWMRNTDRAIACFMSLKGRKGSQGNYKDVKLFNELLKHPELLDAKRNQLKLNRKIKHHEASNQKDDR